MKLNLTAQYLAGTDSRMLIIDEYTINLDNRLLPRRVMKRAMEIMF